MRHEIKMGQLKPEVSERDHRAGPENAKVTLVQYGDYECPYCGKSFGIVKRLQESVSDLRFVFRNFPLSTIHPHAKRAAEAAEAAAAQGKFWEMHDHLYLRQDALDDEHLLEYAKDIGLDLAKFKEAMGEHRYLSRVEEDFSSGVRSGVNGTPTFFINGVRHDGPFDYPILFKAVTKAAREAGSHQVV